MGELLEALGAIGGLGFGGIIILLIAPMFNSITPVNLTAWGVLMFGGAVVLTIVLLIVVVKIAISEL